MRHAHIMHDQSPKKSQINWTAYHLDYKNKI